MEACMQACRVPDASFVRITNLLLAPDSRAPQSSNASTPSRLRAMSRTRCQSTYVRKALQVRALVPKDRPCNSKALRAKVMRPLGRGCEAQHDVLHQSASLVHCAFSTLHTARTVMYCFFLTCWLSVPRSTSIVSIRITKSSILPSVPCMSGSSVIRSCLTPKGNRRWLSLVPENPTTTCERKQKQSDHSLDHTPSLHGFTVCRQRMRSTHFTFCEPVMPAPSTRFQDVADRR